MKSKWLNFLLIITSVLGYLEWAGNNHLFLFEAEYEIMSKLFTEPTSVLHPFTISPLVGQLFLLFTLFQKYPSKTFTFIGIVGIGLLLGLMFIIGLIDLNFRIIFSTIPFLIVTVITILHHCSKKISTKQ